MEALEGRQLLAAAFPGITLDPVLVPKFTQAAPWALDPSFVYTPVAGTTNQYSVGAWQVAQDALGIKNLDGTPRYMTNFLGYGPTDPLNPALGSPTYPGRTFEVQTNSAISVTWTNNLPNQHILPVDWTLQDPAQGFVPDLNNPYGGTFPNGIPIVSHLHGGHTDAASDGTPLQWYGRDPAVSAGMDFTGTTFTYDNTQDASTLWYHDHAMGVTRLNAYAGMAGFYLIRDSNDTGTATNPIGLPAGAQELPLAIQDKMFDVNGQLYFPTMPTLDPVTGATVTNVGIMPEMFGDTILVNGKAWPFMNVEPKRYRLRLLNGSDSRFYTMQINAPTGANQNPDAALSLPIYQIGTDGGLLNAPVTLNQLTLAPGERADVIVDFTNVAPGSQWVIYNSAKTPFPKGGTVTRGTTDRIMMFKVGPLVTPDTSTPVPLLNLRPPTNQVPPAAAAVAVAVNAAAPRQLALFEMMDQYGRLEPLLGTTAGALHLMDPITEQMRLGDTEVWQIYNNTPDAHPIHLHLVQFQLVSRQNFSATVNPVTGAMSKIKLQGAAATAAGADLGWKDTIIMLPGQVTTIVAQFDKPGKYVWHCHILSHEEHDMMRFFEVLPPPPPPVLVAAVQLDSASPQEVVAQAADVTVSPFSTTPVLDEEAESVLA